MDKMEPLKPFEIRDETAKDVESIFDVTKKAFEGHPHSEGTEPYIIDALRKANALEISLVAAVRSIADDSETSRREIILGHVAFSRVSIMSGDDKEQQEDWYGLGPVSVLPKYQKQGIGKALITHGLNRLRRQTADGCVLLGNPKYYNRFGFRNFKGLELPGNFPNEYFLALPFDTTKVPVGIVKYHDAFAKGPQTTALVDQE